MPSATFCVAFQPSSPMLELPSKRRITSSILSQCKNPSFGKNISPHLSVLHAFRSSRASESDSAQNPVPLGASMTSFTLTVLPTSHSFEQLDHGDQSDKTQSLSHDCVLQDSLSLVAPHGSPPCAGWRPIPRLRCFTPPPHSALHPLQPVQSSRAQSIGQVKSLQPLVASSGGQGIPISAGTKTV